MPSQYQRLYDACENDLVRVFENSRSLNHDARQAFLRFAQSLINKEIDLFTSEPYYEE